MNAWQRIHPTSLLALDQFKSVENLNNGESRQLLFSSEIFENISLHLDDAEFLHNAFIVQHLVGTLIRFSNSGRYEPYLAKQWSHHENLWTFNLIPNLTCEDGEIIDAHSFRKNLIASISRFSIDEIKQTPFGSIASIDSAYSNRNFDLIGIKAKNDLTLQFKLTEDVGKTLIEYLAMTPFGYLCASNFQNNKWNPKSNFVSSGAFKLIVSDITNNYFELQYRDEWPIKSINSYNKIIITNSIESSEANNAWIKMSYGIPKQNESNPKTINEVPRALLSLRLGVEDDRFFSSKVNRKILATKVKNLLNNKKIIFENYHKAESFFYGQSAGFEFSNELNANINSIPNKPLIVRAKQRGVSPEVDFYQEILFEALGQLKWPFIIEESKFKSTKDFFKLSYDIAFDRSHVDGTLDPSFVRILFKSKIGPKFQDPGGRISNLLENYDLGKLSYNEFLLNFNKILSEESAIIPLFHRGFAWQFSPEIETTNISPLMSILRFDELIIRNITNK